LWKGAIKPPFNLKGGNMDKKQEFSINREKWQEAKDWGWGISSVSGYETKDQGYKELIQNFVKKRCPALLDGLYNSIQDGLIAAGMNEDHAIEFCEEMVAMPLDEILINLGMEFCPELMEKK
jgi:hypothetical protein